MKKEIKKLWCTYGINKNQPSDFGKIKPESRDNGGVIIYHSQDDNSGYSWNKKDVNFFETSQEMFNHFVETQTNGDPRGDKRLSALQIKISIASRFPCEKDNIKIIE